MLTAVAPNIKILDEVNLWLLPYDLFKLIL